MRRAIAALAIVLGCHEGGVNAVDSGRTCVDGSLFVENFDDNPQLADWQLEVQGNSLVHASLPENGRGANGSNRYLIFINNGTQGPVQLSAATPPRDLSGCSSAKITFALIVFSLETNEGDEAHVDLRGNGSDWTTVAMPFPGTFPSIVECRPGNQDTTGCVAWTSFSIDVPATMVGPGVQARFRLRSTTDMNDAIGIDGVDLRAVR